MKKIYKVIFRNDFFMFIKNIWRFRHALWRFRAYDFDYNLDMLVRSLEITKDFLESDKAMSVSSKEYADQISAFIENIDRNRNAIDYAEKELGYKFSPFTGRVAEKDRILIAKVDEIERKSWNEAMDILKNDMHSWWD